MTSLWAERTPRPDGIAKTLDGDVSVDVLVIGGGMAGMLCAYLLGRAGCSCAVAEQGRVGSGVTQNTTAKVTAQHNLVYDRLIREHGAENARLYYEANQAERLHGRRDGQADGLLRAVGIGHDEVRRQRVQPAVDAFDAGVEALQIYAHVRALHRADPFPVQLAHLFV